MAIKVVCDLCGKETTPDCNFIIPQYEDQVLTWDGRVAGRRHVGIKPCEVHLCDDHIKHLADWIYLFDIKKESYSSFKRDAEEGW